MHLWNMDEKGIQLGGGRKRTGRKYFRLQTLKWNNFYHLKSDNLELITIIECISAAGAVIPPSFVLPKANGEFPQPNEQEVFGSVALSDSGWTTQELTFRWF